MKTKVTFYVGAKGFSAPEQAVKQHALTGAPIEALLSLEFEERFHPIVIDITERLQPMLERLAEFEGE